MTDAPEDTVGQTRLEKQVAELLADETTTADLIQKLDFGYLKHNDEYAEWHASTPLKPVVRALFLKELEDYSISELHRFLSNNSEIVKSFGFSELPSRTTFGRAWRDRFSERLRESIEHNAKRVRELAHERGASIGLNAIEADDKSGTSKRTKQRYIERKTREVTEEMQRLIFPVFRFGRAQNAHYESDAFLELQSHLGLSSSAAESGTDLFSQDTARPEGAPDADTHLYNIKRLEPEWIEEMVDDAIGRIANEARRYLEFDRPADVAVDMTYVAYYGERDELEMVQGAPATKSYDWCYKFATLTVVGENVKLTLAMRPVKKGELVGEVMRDVVDQAREHVSISTVYADSEFCSVETIKSLEEVGLDYVIPSPRNKRVKREIERMDDDVEVRNDYTIHGQVSGEGYKLRPASTNLILLPSTKNPEKTVAFATNKDVDDETQTDRHMATGWVNRYSRRWGIENSYKTIKDFLAWTTSKAFEVRLFYFGFAVLLYNMWLLVDLLVQLSLDIEHRYKPRVTAKRFLNLARKQLAEPD